MSSLPQLLWLRCLESIINCSPITVEPETLVSEVISLMAGRGNSIVVVANSQPLGWLSAQHIVQLVARGIDSTTTKIAAVMEQPAEMLIRITQLLDINTIVAKLHQYQSSCLLVVDEVGQLIGTVTPESIVQAALIASADSGKPIGKSLNLKGRNHEHKTATNILKQSWEQRPIIFNQQNPTEFSSQKNTNKTIYWERNLTNDQIYFLNTIVVGSEPEPIKTGCWDEVLVLVHPDDREEVTQANQSAIANLGSFEIEHRLLVCEQPSTYKRVLARGTTLIDQTGKPTRMIGVTMDIDHQLQTQESLQKINQELEVLLAQRAIALQQQNEQLIAQQTALAKSEERFRFLAESIPQQVWIAKPDGSLEYVNQRTLDFFGSSLEEVLGWGCEKFVHPDDQATCLATWQHSLTTGNDYEVEFRLFMADSRTYRWHLGRALPLRDQQNHIINWFGTNTDIDDRKRAEDSFRLLVENIQDYAIYMLDPQGRVMSWNSGAECITGYQTTEIVGQNFACFFPPAEIAQGLPQRQLEIAASQGRCECESIFVRKDGSQFWANCVLTPLRDAIGNLQGFSKVTRDITQRKLAEESLLRFQKAIESTSDAVVITDDQNVSIYVNPAFVGLYGYNLAELATLGGVWEIAQQIQDRQKISNAIEQRQSWRGEVAMRSPTGQILQVDLRIDAIKDAKGKIFGTVCIHTDITKRQQVEEGLRLRDRAIAASNNGMIIADASIPNGPIIYVNPAFENMTGYSSEEVIGQNFRLFYSADINQTGLSELHTIMQAGNAGTVILQSYRKDGSLFWSELSISPVYDHTDKLTHYIAIQTDITERQQAQTALLVSQQRLQYLLTSSPAVIYASKTSGDFGGLFVSQNISNLLGYEETQFIEDSQFWASCIHPEDKARVFKNLADVLEREQYTLEYRFLHQDGTYRWLYDQGKVIWDKNHQPVELVGYMADITDRKQLEEELTVALAKEKELSELKSRFVSMTSHEFRTPLSIILSSSEFLEHYYQKLTPEKQLTHLKRIQTAVQRMTEMLDDILIIGKAEAGKLEFVPRLFDLVTYCRNLVADTQSHLSNQQIHFTSQEETIKCCMDEKLLGHILGNLLSNAIKYSGINSHIQFRLESLHGQAIFQIEDEGIGIPQEEIPLLFESFHRAKNVGNIPGTGLGLAIVKKCINIHQGEIYVDSVLGSGTIFTVKIPLNNQI